MIPLIQNRYKMEVRYIRGENGYMVVGMDVIHIEKSLKNRIVEFFKKFVR